MTGLGKYAATMKLVLDGGKAPFDMNNITIPSTDYTHATPTVDIVKVGKSTIELNSDLGPNPVRIPLEYRLLYTFYMRYK